MSTNTDNEGESSETKPQTPAGFDFSEQFAKFLQQSLHITGSPAAESNLVLKVKLNGNNYTLWKRLMLMALRGRGKSTHISGVPQPPLPTDHNFARWEQEDQLVLTWLIDNIEDGLINSVLKYPTAKTLWDGLAITYGSGGDPIQVYDLHKQAAAIKQGNQTLESVWSQFQEIWMTP